MDTSTKDEACGCAAAFLYCRLMNILPVTEDVIAISNVRHEDEVKAAALSNKTELSRVTKELEATKATLAQHKMSADSLNSQVNVTQNLCRNVCYCIYTLTGFRNESLYRQVFSLCVIAYQY